MSKETYTKEEVIQLLVNERQRAIDIAYSFKEINDKKYKERKRINKDFAFVYKRISDECRCVGNAISGLTALSLPLNETIKDVIVRELDKQ